MAEQSSGESEHHRLKITPEQRRVLGPARSRQDWPEPKESEPRTPPRGEPTEPAPASPPPAASATVESSPVTTPLRAQSRLARILELQNIALFFGGLLMLFLVFYAGKKFDYWRYELITRLRGKDSAAVSSQFPNASASDLVEQAIVDERIGNWKEAAERLLAAKQKNLRYPGLLFHAAKIYYDHGSFDAADTWFDRALAFGEAVPESNYYRGMIANGRGDSAAAQRFYEAAATAAPFNADYFYSWAETLRRDHRLADAIMRYGQAALRASDAEENMCRFKMRMAMIEAGDAAKVNVDLQNRVKSGPLSVDWIMTQAALELHAGDLDEAVRTLQRARESDTSFLQGHFAACATDKFFVEAAAHYPQLADVLQVSKAR
jgi:tetratricopeptide (TPR) repeat protein